MQDPGTLQYLRTIEGSASLESSNEIVLGEALARKLGAHPGDIVSIVTARAGSGEAGIGLLPKVSAFRLKGIVSAGYRELDSLWAFINAKAGARILSPANSTVLVGIKVDDPFGDLEAIRSSAKRLLPIDWMVSTWPEANKNLYNSFVTTRSLLLLVMALAVAVASVNVGSALSMLAIERRRDIAILKSAGAPRTFIGTVFVMAGLATGGAGTILGLGVGILVAWRVNEIILFIDWTINGLGILASAIGNGSSGTAAFRILDPAYYLERIPVALEPAALAGVAGASLALCLVASLLPAWKAASLPPMEIFRKT
jgi:lipoprotein-releasing system permease protein